MSRRRVELPESIRAIAERTVRRLERKGRISPSDGEDALQTLLVKLIQALPAYDPARGRIEALAQSIVNRAAANFVRNGCAAKRSPRRCVSLHVTIKLDDGEYGELGATISQDETARRTGAPPVDPEAECDRKSDVAEILASLPLADRGLLLRLMHKSIAELAREMGVPATTLGSRIRKFRQRFENAGLREYLR